MNSPDPRRTSRQRALFGVGERGSTQVLIVIPIVMLALFASVHAALVYHGRSVVAAAAQDGLAAVQIENGTTGDGQSAAENTLQLSPGLVDPNVIVSTSNNGDTISVRVTARVESVILGFGSNVSAEVTGPKERFYAETER